MKGQENFDRFVESNPHSHKFFFERPHWSRRRFFQLAGAGVTGSVLGGPARAGDVVAKSAVTTQNKAKNVIFILLSGAMSHVDTFDFKQTPDSPLDVLQPETIGGLTLPAGIMPNLTGLASDLVLVRAARSWALQHSLAQTWAQIGRSPAGVLGNVAPNVGSIVSAEFEKYKKPSDVFPTFLGLNSAGAVGAGYLSSAYAPMKISPSVNGLPNTANADGETRFNSKYTFMQTLDEPYRATDAFGVEFPNYATFYESARGLMFNPLVESGFRYTTAEAQRYGASGFGNACLVAGKVLAANGGTRYIQITFGGWDDHQNIYTVLPPRVRQLDTALAALIADLKSNGLFDETLIVMQGEFGRTVGSLTAQAGRDHFLQQFVVFAGAGVKGGRAIGATDANGSKTTEYGWSRERDVRPEDVEATIYSALGIDWTTIRYDDPLGRGFEYVPFSKQDVYGPINELWAG